MFKKKLSIQAIVALVLSSMLFTMPIGALFMNSSMATPAHAEELSASDNEADNTGDDTSSTGDETSTSEDETSGETDGGDTTGDENGEPTGHMFEMTLIGFAMETSNDIPDEQIEVSLKRYRRWPEG